MGHRPTILGFGQWPPSLSLSLSLPCLLLHTLTPSAQHHARLPAGARLYVCVRSCVRAWVCVGHACTQPVRVAGVRPPRRGGARPPSPSRSSSAPPPPPPPPPPSRPSHVHAHARERERALAVLGLGPAASHEAVVKAYKRLALKHHPDKCRKERNGEKAKETFLRISKAYKTLTALS